MTHTIHPFEKAGLGIAPFRCTGATEKWYVACPGAPKQPGSSCDFCYTGIAYEFWIRSSDGKKFKVGSECVRRTGDKALTTEIERLERKAKLEARHAKEATRIAAAVEKLAQADLQTVLSSLPHPSNYQAVKGLTRLDWATWMLQNAGNAGKLDVARYIDNLPKIDLTEEQKRETVRLAEAKAAFATEQQRQLDEKEAARLALIAENRTLMEALTPHADFQTQNFAASIINDLNYVSLKNLSQRVQNIVSDIIAKGYGRRNSAAYNEKFEEVQGWFTEDNS